MVRRKGCGEEEGVWQVGRGGVRMKEWGEDEGVGEEEGGRVWRGGRGGVRMGRGG